MRKLVLGIFVLQILALASATIIEEIQQDRYYTPQDLTSPFTVTLDFDISFDINITSITGPSGQSAFCEAYPSEIAATVEWNGTIQAGSSYDNVRYYNGRYFALDTVSWRVLVATDMSNSSTYHFIEVDTSVIHQHSTEIPILLIDEKHKYLYIFRSDMAVSYDLLKFNAAITQNTTIPKITSTNAVVQWPLKEYEALKAAKYHTNGNFHFVVDNNTLEVWTTATNGELTFNSLAFDMDYFGTAAVDITDIAFKDNYAFLLDELNGVYVLNITDPTKYTHVNSASTSQVFIADAKFLEITGTTLNVISMNRRSTKLHEYTITVTSSATPSLTLTLNREFDLRDAVRDTHADTNFLYVLTGSQNVAAKHSIPAQYSNASSTLFKDGYTSYWPLSNIGAINAVPNGSSSKVVVIQGTYVTVYNFSETKATLRCRAGNFKTGTYVYNLMSMQRTCKAKTTSSTSDVCRVRQPVTITINSSAKQVLSNDDSSNNTGLVVGIIVAIITVGAIVFAYWYFKLRNKTPTPTVRNDVFFRRLSRSPLNQDSSNLYKVTMDVERSGARPDDHHDDKLGAMRKKSDDFVLGPQRSDDAEESPKRAAIVRGKTFSEIEKPKKPVGAPKTNTLANIEGIHRDYEADI